jgi:hypothetical protein
LSRRCRKRSPGGNDTEPQRRTGEKDRLADSRCSRVRNYQPLHPGRSLPRPVGDSKTGISRPQPAAGAELRNSPGTPGAVLRFATGRERRLGISNARLRRKARTIGKRLWGTNSRGSPDLGRTGAQRSKLHSVQCGLQKGPGLGEGLSRLRSSPGRIPQPPIRLKLDPPERREQEFLYGWCHPPYRIQRGWRSTAPRQTPGRVPGSRGDPAVTSLANSLGHRVFERMVPVPLLFISTSPPQGKASPT